jgi:predicted nucleotidyltransferase
VVGTCVRRGAGFLRLPATAVPQISGTPDTSQPNRAFVLVREFGFDIAEELLSSNVALVKRAQIRAFSNAIAREFHPRKIVLFGSYAYGKPTEDSDVDLLVIMPFNRKRGRKSLEIRQRIPADFPLDLIVRTPEFITRRLQWGDCFTEEILARGEVLYEAADARVGEKSLGRFRSRGPNYAPAQASRL